MKKKPLIDYTNFNFESIKDNLVEHAKRYYPDRYNDFNESSFGSMVFDAAAYVGDVMSYYLDFQVNESFLETAISYDNVRKVAAQMGYNFYARPAAFGMVDLYVLVPALDSDLGPNESLYPVIKRGSLFKSSNGAIFTLLEDVDFSSSTVDFASGRFDPETNKATHYVLRSEGRVKSGAAFLEEIEVGPYEKFRKVRVGSSGINEIVSVFDTEGNEYYEVDHLSQEIVYLETTNPNAKNDGVTSILKPFIASRRFVTIQDETGTYLQFGYGSEDEFDKTGIIDPATVMLNMNGKNFITDTAFDPNKLISTDKFGVVPSNTTLRVTFGSNNSVDNNVAKNQLNEVASLEIDFPHDELKTLSNLYQSITDSVEVSNSEQILYNSEYPTIDEIKYRTYASYAAQHRAVTKTDYESYSYQMPAKFGSIKRVSIYNDPSGTNKRLCFYVISNDQTGFLVKCNDVTKNNLKVWLNKNKMISDLIDIKDARIINIGFDYEYVIDPRFNRLSVMSSVEDRLLELFDEDFYIGEPLYISEIYNVINKTKGVVDTIKVTPRLMLSSGYADINIGTIDDIMSKDGTFIKTPKNCILEIKYPLTDMRGIAR